MSKKISINIGRIVIGFPSKSSIPPQRSRAHEILQQIFAGTYKEEKEDEPELAIEEIRDSLTKHVGTLEEDLADMNKEEHPEKILTIVDGYGDVDMAKAKEVLSARVADLKPILELVNKAIANEEARQEAAKNASKDTN